MDPSRIHEDITQLLYKVEEQYSHILQHKERIPLLEVDLVLKDVSTLYECFLDLRAIAEFQRKKGVNKPTEAASPLQEAKAVVAESEDLKAEPEPLAELKPASEQAIQPIEKAAADVPAEPATDVQPIDVPKNQVSEPVAGTTSTEPAKTPESPIYWQKTFDASLSKPEEIDKPASVPVPKTSPVPPQVTAPKVDLLKEREKDFVPTVRKIEFKPEPVATDNKKESIFDKAASLYDKIAKPVEKSVAAQASKQPISNIKSSIGINEKFSYLKDLFRNNVGEYNEALDKLNNFDSYADAEDYFQELKAKYSWDPDGKSFLGLAELLNRRYLHNV